MVEFRSTVLYKLWIFIVGVLVIANLLLLFARGTSGAASTSNTVNVSSEPNAVTASMVTAVSGFGVAVNHSDQAINRGSRGLSQAAAQSGHAFASATVKSSRVTVSVATRGTGFAVATNLTSFRLISRATAASALFAGNGVFNSVAMMLHITGTVGKFAFNTPVMSAIIRPSATVATPAINPMDADTLPELPAPKTATAAVATPAAAAAPARVVASSVTPQWPLHGVITTLFGVPELPYEAIHTGLDISDGKAPGTTPIHPYRPGVVQQVIHSSLGLGNHVIIDHGSGVTSVYGHLNSTSVVVGQTVDETTVVGYEGTTGVSTGTHLHFEIRINGTPVNPLGYITGRP